MAARFEGVPVVELLPDGINIKLRSELTFYDPQEVRWSVPPDAVVDGASIPSAFWTVVGSPLTGRYRDASIIHDWFCDKRTRTWQATHRVFYDAMIVSGVDPFQAKVMYYGVLWRGPRWEERVSRNTNLDAGDRYSFDGTGPGTGSAGTTRRLVAVPSPGDAIAEHDQHRIVATIVALIRKEDTPLDRIEELAEQPRPE